MKNISIYTILFIFIVILFIWGIYKCQTKEKLFGLHLTNNAPLPVLHQNNAKNVTNCIEQGYSQPTVLLHESNYIHAQPYSKSSFCPGPPIC